MLKKTPLMVMTSLGLLLSGISLQAYEIEALSNEKNKNDTSVATPHSLEKQGERSGQPIDMKKLSEAFGHFIGRNLQSPGLSFDLESIIKGVREGAAGKPAPLSEKEYEEMMAVVQEKAFKEISTSNLKAADEFMQKNRETAGIIEVVPGKLQYLVLKEGTGPSIEAHGSPKINYTGRYQDGTVFSSSEEMGGAITIPIDQTISGFSKGIVGMKKGEKRRIFVHPDFGYGTNGQLLPNSLLIFDIEAVEIHSDEAKDKTPHSADESTDVEDDDDLFLEEEKPTKGAHGATYDSDTTKRAAGSL